MKSFRKMTDEDRASEELFDFFNESSQAIVHSWHPPDGKAYFTLLLQIPQIGNKLKTFSGRDHVDLIVQINDSLILIEVKGNLSESAMDIEKLNNIKSNYTINSLIKLFEQQGIKFRVKPTKLILALAARYIDYSIPDDFAVFQSGDGNIIGIDPLAKDILNFLI